MAKVERYKPASETINLNAGEDGTENSFVSDRSKVGQSPVANMYQSYFENEAEGSSTNRKNLFLQRES